MMVSNDLAKEIQNIKRAWAPELDKDKDKDKDRKGKGRHRKQGNAVNKVAAEEDPWTSDAP